MDSNFESQGNEPRPIHHALFGNEEVVNSVDDLIENHHQSRFAIDPVGVIEQMTERELRDFVDLFAAHADAFTAEHIRNRLARRDNDDESTGTEPHDIEVATDIAGELKGEINQKVMNPDAETPLLRVLFP